MFDDEPGREKDPNGGGVEADKNKLQSDAPAATNAKKVDLDALEVLGAEEGSLFGKDTVKMFDLPASYRVTRQV